MLHASWRHVPPPLPKRASRIDYAATDSRSFARGAFRLTRPTLDSEPRKAPIDAGRHDPALLGARSRFCFRWSLVFSPLACLWRQRRSATARQPRQLRRATAVAPTPAAIAAPDRCPTARSIARRSIGWRSVEIYLCTGISDTNADGAVEPGEIRTLLFYPTSATAKWVDGGNFTRGVPRRLLRHGLGQ